MMSPTRIGFVLVSNSASPAPSTRIAVLNMFPYLRAGGFEPEILFEPSDANETPELSAIPRLAVERDLAVVVFQKVHGESAERAAAGVAAAGIKSMYLVCDLMHEQMVAATDATVATTDYLRGLHPLELRRKIEVIHDGIERPTSTRSHGPRTADRGPVRCRRFS